MPDEIVFGPTRARRSLQRSGLANSLHKTAPVKLTNRIRGIVVIGNKLKSSVTRTLGSDLSCQLRMKGRDASNELGSLTVPAEAALEQPCGFVNGYEASKWQAEQFVQGAGGSVVILRLATVAGSQSDGSLRRVGAFHNVLRWVYRGLLPLIPGDSASRSISFQRSMSPRASTACWMLRCSRHPCSIIFREASRRFDWAN